MTEQPIDANTRLAAERTWLALERTLMAWVRTCTSLIAFGFTINQAFRYLSTLDRLKAPLVSPQVFGAVMIVIGLASLVMAWVQHRQGVRRLQAEFGTMPRSIAGVISGLIACLGILALVGVALRF
jgi:putative membrane protein